MNAEHKAHVLEKIKSNDNPGSKLDEPFDLAAYEREKVLRRWHPYPDPAPGVLSFQAETPPPDDIRNFKVEEAASLNDGDGVEDINNPTEYEKVYLANAPRACAGCAAHCCRAFRLSKDPTTEEGAALWREGIEREAKEREDGSEFMLRALADIDFMQKFFVRLDTSKIGGGDLWFGCKALNKKTGRCTQYENRPLLCRKYLCAGAMAGVTPGPNAGFYAQKLFPQR